MVDPDLVSKSLALNADQRGELAAVLLQSLEADMPKGQRRSAADWHQEVLRRSGEASNERGSRSASPTPKNEIESFVPAQTPRLRSLWMQSAVWIWDHKVLVAGLVLLLNVGPFWLSKANRSFRELTELTQSLGSDASEFDIATYTRLKSRHADHMLSAGAAYSVGGLLAISGVGGSLWKWSRSEE
ncbi:MAG: hypothetical protein AAGJ46_12455 [Planctomycetota bacterium]